MNQTDSTSPGAGLPRGPIKNKGLDKVKFPTKLQQPRPGKKK